MAISTGEVLMVGLLGGGVAYVTNFMGFRDWVSGQFGFAGGQETAPGGQFGEPGGSGKTVGEEEKDIINKLLNPTPRKTSTTTSFNCVSYPRCNVVAGTDARKKCCCTNQCSLRKKSNQTMSPTMDFARGLCLCNYKTIATTPPKCYGPCPLGKKPALVSGRCGCVNCPACALGYKMESGCRCRYNCSCTYGISRLTVGGCICKTPPRVSGACPYAGCTSQTSGVGCFTCRCTNICKQYPNTHPQIKADGSCSCIKNLSARQAQAHAYKAGNEILDSGLMQVPTIA